MNGVKIDVLIVGDYPGDGSPKPVSFPAPEAVREGHDGSVPYVNLVSLLELKIASGMTAAHRLQDLADAIQLIRVYLTSPAFMARWAAEEMERHGGDGVAHVRPRGASRPGGTACARC